MNIDKSYLKENGIKLYACAYPVKILCERVHDRVVYRHNYRENGSTIKELFDKLQSENCLVTSTTNTVDTKPDDNEIKKIVMDLIDKNYTTENADDSIFDSFGFYRSCNKEFLSKFFFAYFDYIKRDSDKESDKYNIIRFKFNSGAAIGSRCEFLQDTMDKTEYENLYERTMDESVPTNFSKIIRTDPCRINPRAYTYRFISTDIRYVFDVSYDYIIYSNIDKVNKKIISAVAEDLLNMGVIK